MWFTLALLAGLLFSINKLIFRAVFTKEVEPISFMAAHDFIAGALLLPVALINFTLPHNPKTWLGLVLGILFIFIANLFAALSLKKTEASLYQIAGQLRHIVTLFGGYLLFSEALTVSKAVSIVLIMLGVFIAIKEKSKLHITRGVNYAFISALAIGLAFLFIKLASVDVKPAVSASLSLIVSGVLAYILLIFRRKRPTKLVPVVHIPQLVVAAIIFAVFEFVLFTALNIGQASRVTPVTQSSMIFTLIGGYIFLNERQRIRQKVIGGLVIAVGIGLLYFV